MRPVHGYFLTTEEAATLAGVQPATIRTWVHRRTLRPVRIGDSRLWFTARAVAEAEYANRRGRRARSNR